MTVEVAFDLNKRLHDFADAKVVQLYAWLLEGYASNTTFLNHVLVSFLERIAHPTTGQNLAPMLYHLRLLRTLCAILNDRALRGDKRHARLLQWSAGVVRGLFALLVPSWLGKKPEEEEAVREWEAKKKVCRIRWWLCPGVDAMINNGRCMRSLCASCLWRCSSGRAQKTPSTCATATRLWSLFWHPCLVWGWGWTTTHC